MWGREKKGGEQGVKGGMERRGGSVGKRVCMGCEVE